MTNFYHTKYRIGDRINILGYGDEIFVIYAVYHDYYIDAETEYFETYYDCYREKDGEYYYAEEADITLVERPEKRDFDEIRKQQEKANQSIKENVMRALRDAFLEPERLEAAGDESINKNEKIDELLTELSDVMTLISMFGEHEDDEKRDRKYALRKCEIEAELINLIEEGKGR